MLDYYLDFFIKTNSFNKAEATISFLSDNKQLVDMN